MTPTRLIVVYAAFLAVFVMGFAFGALSFGGTAKVDLAPNGMAYCPADSSTPHPTPCMFRQP